MWLVGMAGNKMDFDAATVVVLQAWLVTTAMAGALSDVCGNYMYVM